MRRSINITLLAYCVCVYLRVGTVHLYAAVLLLPLTQLFSGWTLLNPPSTLPPPPSTKFQAVKNPNENRNNGKEMFFFGLHRPVQPVSFNGVRPSNCSWFHSPTLPAMYPGYLSIKFLNSSSKPPTNPYVHPIFRHSFVHPSGIHPHMHTDLPFIYPQNHPPIHATMHVTSHQPTVLY